MNACRSSNALTTVEKDTFLATPLLEEVRLSHNPSLYWIHPEVLHCTVLYYTVLYFTVLYCTVLYPGLAPGHGGHGCTVAGAEAGPELVRPH